MIGVVILNGKTYVNYLGMIITWNEYIETLQSEA